MPSSLARLMGVVLSWGVATYGTAIRSRVMTDKTVERIMVWPSLARRLAIERERFVDRTVKK
jgi:hypothetical protein